MHISDFTNKEGVRAEYCELSCGQSLFKCIETGRCERLAAGQLVTVSVVKRPERPTIVAATKGEQ